MCPVIRFPKEKILNSIKHKKYRERAASNFIKNLKKEKIDLHSIKYTASEIQKILKRNHTLNKLKKNNIKKYAKFIKYMTDNVHFKFENPNQLRKKLKKFDTNLKLKKLKDSKLAENRKSKEKIFNKFLNEKLSSKEKKYIQQFIRIFKIQEKLSKGDIIPNTLAYMTFNLKNENIKSLYNAIKTVYKHTVIRS